MCQIRSFSHWETSILKVLQNISSKFCKKLIRSHPWSYKLRKFNTHYLFPDLFCMEGGFSNFKKRSQENIFGFVYNVILLQGLTLLIFSVIVLQKTALIDYSYEHLPCLHNFLYLLFCQSIYVCLQGIQLPQSMQTKFPCLSHMDLQAYAKKFSE